MLRLEPVLPRALPPWLGQAAASLGAMAVAVTLFAAVPRSPVVSGSVGPDPVLAERTSGGKFAARVRVDASQAALLEQADQTRKPLPVPSLAVASGPMLSAPMSEAGSNEVDAGASGLSPPARVLRLPSRSDIRHAGDAGAGARVRNSASAWSGLPSPQPALSAPDGPGDNDENGLASILGPARAAASLAAETGRALFERVGP